MGTKLKREHIEDAFNYLKGSNPELQDFTLHNADGRLGKMVALAKVKVGSVDIKTDFMTYTEMNCFIRGYGIKGENRF